MAVSGPKNDGMTTNIFSNNHDYTVNVFLFHDDDDDVPMLVKFSVGIPYDDL